MEEDNVRIAEEVLADYLWLHKEIGFNGLARESNLPAKLLSAIRYEDPDCKVTDNHLRALRNGLESIRDKTIKNIECLIERIDDLVSYDNH